jgi:hypothetical protein
MSTSKNSAITVLIIGSVFWFVKAIFDFIIPWYYQFQYGSSYNYITFDYLTGPTLELVASLLLMIGFIMLRSKNSAVPTPGTYPTFPTSTPTLSAGSGRVCPNCGKQISANVKFCPSCGWRLTEQSP